MSLLFENPALWPFALLVAGPLLLHLFARARPPAYPFGWVELIRRLQRQTMRIKRPQDYLLLALRTLLVAALVALFLLPLLFLQRRLAGVGQRKNVVLVVDATASMAYNDRAQTRFATATAEAAAVLAGLGGRDTANLVWLTSRPKAVFPAMGGNIAYLRQELRRATVTSQAGDVAGAWQRALDLLADAEGRREICVISDFQRTAWERAVLAAPPGITVVKLKVGRDPAPNCAIVGIHWEPGRPLPGEEISFNCEVANYSGQPRRETVYLGFHEGREARELLVPAWGQATATFRLPAPAPGAYPVSAALDEDPFPADNRRWAIVSVIPALQVGIVPGDPATVAAWRRALLAMGWAEVRELALSDRAGIAEMDVLMLAGWDGTAAEVIGERQAAGTTVLCQPAAGCDAAALGKLFAVEAGVPRREQDDRGWGLRVRAAADPVFAVFADGEAGNPARARFKARLQLAMAGGDQLVRLLDYDDGVPALARRGRQGGGLLLWNLPLDPRDGDLGRRPEYLPLLGEALLTARARPANTGIDFLPGEELRPPASLELLSGELQLEDGDGRPLAWPAPFATPPPCGVYAWRHKGRLVGHSTMNFPVVESDLRTLDQVDLRTADGVAVISGEQVRNLRDGWPLWPWLLALAVVLALAEGGVSLWAERS